MQSYRTDVAHSQTNEAQLSSGRVHTSFLRAARRYAERGISVFPCKPGSKNPLTPNGFYDATTSREKIRKWWTSWPNANIAAPTGKPMGAFVLDVDAGKGGPESLAALEAEHGPLPETARAKTGRSGLHYYFTLPEGEDIRNGAGDFASGLDVRGTGGYVVLSPSTTQAAYEWLSTAEIADAPPWLLELVKKKRRTSRSRDGESGNHDARDTRHSLIGEGHRNNKLTRIAGKLRGNGAEHEDLEIELLRINSERCDPPLSDKEVLRIASSVARYPKGGAVGTSSAEVAEDLDAAERVLFSREWKRTGGKSERDIYVELIKAGRRHGTSVEDGVRISIGVRTLALAAALSKPATINGARRLKEKGLIRSDNANRSGTQAGAFVLLVDPSNARAKVDHSTMLGGSVRHGKASGKGSRAPLSAPRLRWSGPHPDDPESRIRRLGKSAGAVVDVLEAAGGSASVAGVAETLGFKRPRDLIRRSRDRVGVMARLVDAGIVAVAGDTVTLVGEWLEALNEEREATGEIRAYRRDLNLYNRQREAYRLPHRDWHDYAPSQKEMDRRRRKRAEGVRAALYVPDRGPALALKTYLEKPNDVRFMYLVKAVLVHQGVRDLDGWESTAPLVREALSVEEPLAGRWQVRQEVREGQQEEVRSCSLGGGG